MTQIRECVSGLAAVAAAFLPLVVLTPNLNWPLPSMTRQATQPINPPARLVLEDSAVAPMEPRLATPRPSVELIPNWDTSKKADSLIPTTWDGARIVLLEQAAAPVVQFMTKGAQAIHHLEGLNRVKSEAKVLSALENAGVPRYSNSRGAGD